VQLESDEPTVQRCNAPVTPQRRLIRLPSADTGTTPYRRWARFVAIVAALLSVGACSPSSTPAKAVAPSGGSEHFATLPPGSPLPSDAECHAKVRSAPEVRKGNSTFNQVTGHPTPPAPDFPLAERVTGDFTGTTDEIIQWAACKWGIDEDVVRAQVAKESWWHQDGTGDYTGDPNLCAPGHGIGADGKDGQCPESVGLVQVRAQYFRDYIDDAAASSAYNLDIAYAIWRSCFDGNDTWLNTVERGKDYAGGDQWGCIGRWFSGRWYTQAANDYIAAVKQYLDQRVWSTKDFAKG
jgi:autotransporter family porin